MNLKSKIAVILFVIYGVILTYLYTAPFSIEGAGHNADKAVHFGIFALGSVLYLFLVKSGIGKGLCVFFGTVLLSIPFGLETIQGYLSYRVYDNFDLLANYVGIAVPLFVYFSCWILKRFRWFSWFLFPAYTTFAIYVQLNDVFSKLFTEKIAVVFDIALFFSVGLLFFHTFTIKNKVLSGFFVLFLVVFPQVLKYMNPSFGTSKLLLAYLSFLAARLFYDYLKKPRIQKEPEVSQKKDF
ncbi:hypothetical protein DU53_06385 [Kosmotoga sp. DU53]|nr:hypothetical protein DU53_06385 [Kosmotoga sp. DU53]